MDWKRYPQEEPPAEKELLVLFAEVIMTFPPDLLVYHKKDGSDWLTGSGDVQIEGLDDFFWIEFNRPQE